MSWNVSSAIDQSCVTQLFELDNGMCVHTGYTLLGGFANGILIHFCIAPDPGDRIFIAESPFLFLNQYKLSITQKVLKSQ